MNEFIKRYGKEKRWVTWRLETRKGKTTKIPYQLNGKAASSTDPKTWDTYEAITKKSENVGITLHDNLLLAIDLDHVLDKKTGKLNHPKREQILELLKAANSYTEISPSGEGLHIFLELEDPLSLAVNKAEPVEAYVNGRYLTFTGKVFGKPRPMRKVVAEEAYRAIEKMVPQEKETKAKTEKEEFFGRSSTGGRTTSPPVQKTKKVNSSTILEKMFAASNGPEIEKLYNGDISAYKDDASRADAAILAHFAFWTQKDPSQMEALWMASPLGKRKKTQSRQDYRARSITAAIARCKETYNPELKGISEVSIGDLGLLYYLKDKTKVYYKNLENITRVILRHPDFEGMFRYDEYKEIIERCANGKWRSLQDHDSIAVQAQISVLFSDFAHVSKEMTYDAIIRAARENAIDSGADYIRSLEWDKKPRLATWLNSTYHTPSDEYHRTIGENWLKGMVKRIIQPGSKFDYVLVLEGKQGIRKSTSLDVLAGILGHVETTISTEQKDFFMLMQGNAIIEFSEGETLSRTEVKQLKSVISTQVDKYREPYGRTTTPHPRRCVFAMTTNQREYLKDETGNRRWLPVAVEGNVDIEWLQENREQLLAEAYARIAETTWEFPEDELEQAQIERRVRDPNTDVIVNWYWLQPEMYRTNGVTVSDVFMHALHGGFMSKPISRADEMSIADVLRTWLRLDVRRVMNNGIRSNRYFPTEKTKLLEPAELPVAVSQIKF